MTSTDAIKSRIRDNKTNMIKSDLQTGAKTDSIAFLSGGTLGLWFAAPAEFRFAECSSQKLIANKSIDQVLQISIFT